MKITDDGTFLKGKYITALTGGVYCEDDNGVFYSKGRSMHGLKNSKGEMYNFTIFRRPSDKKYTVHVTKHSRKGFKTYSRWYYDVEFAINESICINLVKFVSDYIQKHNIAYILIGYLSKLVLYRIEHDIAYNQRLVE